MMILFRCKGNHYSGKSATFARKKVNIQMKKIYTDLFIDFDDTLYNTHGNAVIALRELFEAMDFGRWFADPDVFYTEYWNTNIDLWGRYSKGEITRDYLIVERFRRPLSIGMDTAPTEAYCREVGDRFLDFCATKPGLIEGARELMDYLRGKGYRLHMCSNGFHEVQYRKLRACGLDQHFTTIILSEDAGANKPSAQYFDYAFKVSAAPKETTLMIGDNFQTDILGAKQVGLDTAFFNRFPEYPAPEAVTYEVTTLRQLMDIL